MVLSFQCGYCILVTYLDPCLRGGIGELVRGESTARASPNIFSPRQKHSRVTCVNLLLF